MELRRSAAEMAEALSSEARDVHVNADNSDRLDLESPIGTASQEGFALAANAFQIVGETDRVLGRFSSGTYRYCEACGEEIPYQRLRALPTTTACFGCKNRRFQRRAVRMAAVERISI